MTLKRKNIILLIGMVMTIISFIFFGLSTKIYNAILLLGITISFFSFCTILFQKDSVRSKLLWTGIVVAGIGIQWLSEPFLINLSYTILVKQNQSVFSKVNDLLISKKTDAIWVSDSSLWKRNNITQKEGLQIQHLLKEIRIIRVQKDSSRIYYMTFSRIDIAHGISYYYQNEKPKNSRHLIGNWYL